MKNNKGLTLVELIVSIAILGVVILEVFSVMSNSSVIYRNGSYDVSLQTEAHQVISQFEELAIDANSSISYTTGGTGGSCIITNKNVTYKIDLIKDPAAVSGTMYLSATPGGSNVVMAEYVESFDVDTSKLATTNKIVLNVHMKREREAGHYYEYTATKDIYLRNRVGSLEGYAGDEAAKNTAGGGETGSVLYQYELNVLRYHTYDLNAEFGLDGSYTFEFESGPLMSSLELSGSMLKGNTTFNANDRTNDKECYIVAKQDGNLKFRIRAYAEPVQVGMGDIGENSSYMICYINGNTNTTVRTNLAMFRGISADPEDIGTVRYQLVCELTGKEAPGNFVDYSMDFKDPIANEQKTFITSYHFFEQIGDKYYMDKDDPSKRLLIDGKEVHKFKLKDNNNVGYIRFGSDPNGPTSTDEDYFKNFKIPERIHNLPKSKSSRYRIQIYKDENSTKTGSGNSMADNKVYVADDNLRIKYRFDGGASGEWQFKMENVYVGLNAQSNALFFEATQFMNKERYVDFTKYGNSLYLNIQIDYGYGDPINIKCIPVPTNCDMDAKFWETNLNTDGVFGYGEKFGETINKNTENSAVQENPINDLNYEYLIGEKVDPDADPDEGGGGGSASENGVDPEDGTESGGTGSEDGTDNGTDNGETPADGDDANNG